MKQTPQKQGGNMEKTKRIVMKNFPVDLDRKAKAQAALEGITYKALVIKSLEAYLKTKGGKR
jgi:hypothetical protein